MKDSIAAPNELVDRLIALFPRFFEEWNGGEEYGYEDGDFSYHSVISTFAPLSAEYLNESQPKKTKAFSELLNYAVENGGALENAVSTCLLEHASQLGIRGTLLPYLCPKARQELR
ncbi:DUF7674 family protein [Thiosocius teredinicola]|uniref:DUF7674 family protein n=1 Tax=Thiosocius teredinicola TaxID=1973002 RepID=UPI00099105B9